VSLVYVLKDGDSAEDRRDRQRRPGRHLAFYGGETTPSRAVVQSAGEGYRLKASGLKKEFERGGAR
jgi:hypothetical protein